MRFDNTKYSGISIGSGPLIASNTSFRSGIYDHNSSERLESGLELLQKRVAPSAFHDFVQRLDPPRCHPDTRVAIQKQIYDWIVLDFFVRQTWIMWMHGAAGGGKSAIMQSVAELCEKEQFPLASFFFSRTDPTRNSMAPFIATLVYQITQKIPQSRDEIFMIIEDNPLIFDESLESQLQQLVVQPLLRLRKHFKGYFVVMIDGLDECLAHAQQVNLIRQLGSVPRLEEIPVLFLVASRCEPQIQAAFIREDVSDLVLTLPLDNSDIEQTSDDIRRYLVDKFRDITETHPYKYRLPIDWPSASSVEDIVSMSSGLFIFASISINYLLSSPFVNPAPRLKVISEVLKILAYMMITGMDDIRHIEGVFLLWPGQLERDYLTDLADVIRCEFGEISFLHTSHPRFRLGKVLSEAEQYYIDVEGRLSYLLRMFLERGPPIFDPRSQDSGFDTVSLLWGEYHRIWAIRNLLAHEPKASDELQRSFMTFSVNPTDKNSFEHHSLIRVIEILKYVEELNFNDRGQAYRHVLDIFAPGFARYWSIFRNSDKDRVRDIPDLSARISQILGEKL